MDNLEEVDKFLEICKLPRLNQKEIESINRPINNNEMKSEINKQTNSNSKQQKSRTRWLHRWILPNI